MSPRPIPLVLVPLVLACGTDRVAGVRDISLPSPSVSASALDFSSVSAASDHSCGITAAGVAFCWGNNSYGQLGTGQQSGATIPVVVAGNLSFRSISTGTTHTCGVTTSGQGYCWGSDAEGQLGGAATSTCTGGPCAFAPIPVLGGRTWLSIDAGGVHSCGLDLAGSAFCWGRNTYGQLGDGTTAQRVTPVAVAGGRRFARLVAGVTNHSCGVTRGGATFCWGENRFGQLGAVTSQTCALLPCARSPIRVAGGLLFRDVDAGGLHTCAFTAAGQPYCWGRNVYMQLGDGSTIDRRVPTAVQTTQAFAAITAGFRHSCAITLTGEGYCWGADGGRLGTGGAPNPGVPLLVAGGHTWRSMGAGGEHTCGADGAGAGYCWGHEDYGELGDGGLRQSTVLIPVPVADTDQPPVASFFVVGCFARTCTFNATASRDDVGISAYHWAFSDGGTDTGPIVTYTFGAAGTYTVTLTVTDTAGQTGSASQQVTVF